MPSADFTATSSTSRETDPRSVLQSIGALQGCHAPDANDSSELVAHSPVPAPSPQFPKLMIAPEYAEDQQRIAAEQDVLQTTIDSAKQIQQLAKRLKEKQNELAELEDNLEATAADREAAAASNAAEYEKRWQQLRQQTSQIRIQQQHVMQLQNDILSSHQATGIAIEQIVIAPTADAETVRHLRTLQHELGSRFDYIARRWEHLYRLLENQRVQLHAAEGLPERPNWAS